MGLNLQFIIALLLLCIFFVKSSVLSLLHSIQSPTKSVNHVKSVVELKSGTIRNPISVWYHKGIMRNPMTGSAVAGIEGLEFNRYLGSNQSQVSNVTVESTSYLSKKMFVYTDLTNSSTVTPLTKYKVQFLSPFRKVQPVKVFSEKVTLSVDTNDSVQCTVEFPGNRTVSTKKIQINPVSETSDGVKNSRQYNIVQFITAGKRKSFTDITKWISFSSPANTGSGKNQEYYMISDQSAQQNVEPPIKKKRFFRRLFSRSSRDSAINTVGSIDGVKSGNSSNMTVSAPLATMRYVRYGECPSWYSLHKPVSVEIDSQKFNSLSQCPSHIVPLVKLVNPSFLDNCTIDNFNTVESFKKEIDLASEYKPWYLKLKDSSNCIKSWFCNK